MSQKSKVGLHEVSIGLNKKKNRKGIHSKNKTSTNKRSKNYVKQYRGQGK